MTSQAKLQKQRAYTAARCRCGQEMNALQGNDCRCRIRFEYCQNRQCLLMRNDNRDVSRSSCMTWKWTKLTSVTAGRRCRDGSPRRRSLWIVLHASTKFSAPKNFYRSPNNGNFSCALPSTDGVLVSTTIVSSPRPFQFCRRALKNQHPIYKNTSFFLKKTFVLYQ